MTGATLATAVRMIAADGVLCLAGLAAVGPTARRLGMPGLPRLALGLFTGVGLVAVLTTLLAISGGPTAVLPLLGPLVGAVAVLGALGEVRALRGRRPLRGERPLLVRPGAEWLGYVVCLAFTARFALTAWHNPVRNNDEYGTWALRGTVLSFGHLDPLIMGGGANPRTYQNREYPLGLSALYSWVRGWVGPAWAEYAGHVQVPLLAGCGMVIALWVLRRVAGPLVGVLLAPTFFALAFVGGYTGVLLFGDLPNAAAGLAVTLLVLRWVHTRDHGWLLLALGPAVAAVFLKQEGLVFVAAPCLVAAVMARSWRPLAVLGASVATLVPWQVWLHTQGIGSRILRWPTPDPGAASLPHAASQVTRLMVGYWPEPFHTRWVVLAVLLGVLLAVLVPRTRPEIYFLGAVFAVILAGIWSQYLLSAPHMHASDIPGYLAFTAPRVLTLPAALSWLIALLPAGAAWLPPTEPTPAEPTPTAATEDSTDDPEDSAEDASEAAAEPSPSAGSGSSPHISA